VGCTTGQTARVFCDQFVPLQSAAYVQVDYLANYRAQFISSNYSSSHGICIDFPTDLIDINAVNKVIESSVDMKGI